jgi:hypothetical protein
VLPDSVVEKYQRRFLVLANHLGLKNWNFVLFSLAANSSDKSDLSGEWISTFSSKRSE